MTDIVSKKKRSEMMSGIKGKDTKPEIATRKMMYKMGLRYRLHRKDLPGKPDIVLGTVKLAIFVHGCFWHRHNKCKYSYSPKTRVNFWEKKFQDNVKRDMNNRHTLEELGWKSAVIWECQTKDPDDLKKNILNIIESSKKDRSII